MSALLEHAAADCDVLAEQDDALDVDGIEDGPAPAFTVDMAELGPG